MNKIYNILKINKKVLLAFMALITYASLCFSSTLRVYDILSWLILLILLLLYNKTNIFNKTLKREIIILSVLFSFMIVYGDIAYYLQEDIHTSIFNKLISIKCLLEYIGVFNLIYIILTNIIPKLYTFSLKKKRSIINKPMMIFMISFIFIFVMWMPYFLTFYPGTLTPDSIGELSTVINKFTVVSDHHPVIHMLFISIPYNIGFKIFNSISAGVAFVSITQMIIMSSIFSSLIVFLYKRKVNDYILLVILLFYALAPMHGYYSITMWKDVIFSGLLLLLGMQLVKIIENNNNNSLTMRSLMPFIIVSVLCVFFRNNAIYMYFILIVVTLLMFKKHIKIFLIVFLLVLGTYFIVKGPIFSYLNISKSASAEYIGMPLQQIGRMAYKKVNFTKEEKRLINELIPVSVMEKVYNPKVSDGIKFDSNYKGDVFDKNKLKYFKLWIDLVMKHPDIAVEAYSISTLGYWYPGVEYWSVSNGIWENSYNLEIESKAPKLIKYYVKHIESRAVPVVNIEWSIGLFFWIILLFGMLSYKKNKLYGIYPFIPVFGIWLTMMVASPVFAEFRYVYGAFTSLPLLMMCPYLSLNKKN